MSKSTSFSIVIQEMEIINIYSLCEALFGTDTNGATEIFN